MNREITGPPLKEADLFPEGKALVDLAKKYGTPLYVYDGDLIIRRFKELFNFIKWPKLRILYAVKANYNIAVLKLLKDQGAYLDAVSPAEVHLALKLGYSPDQILYTANNITDEEMHEVKKTGVLMNIGSLSRLEKYGRAYPGTGVCLRFNPDVVAGAHEYVKTGGELTKFGILLQEVPAVKKIANQYHLKIIGLHEHTGSGIAETKNVYQSMKNLLISVLLILAEVLKFLIHRMKEESTMRNSEKRLLRFFQDFAGSMEKNWKCILNPGNTSRLKQAL
jgi:diaminopimelate decarboxylase